MAGIKETLTLEFDGGSRGNPGPAGIGIVIRAAAGTPLVMLGRFIGHATNNVAEYNALIAAMEQAQKLGASKIVIRGDSELVIKQMQGVYRVRHPAMIPLHQKATHLMAQFEDARIEHNLRHKNELADKLANLAMDRKRDVTDAEDDSAAQSRHSSPPPASAPDFFEAPPIATECGDRQVCPRCGCCIELCRPSSLRPHQLKPFVCQCGLKMLPAPRES